MLGLFSGELIRSKGYSYEEFPASLVAITICDAIINAGIQADEKTMKDSVVTSISNRLTSRDKEYFIVGCTPIGWIFDSLERTREVARWVCETCSLLPEEIKKAEIFASVIYLIRNNTDNEDVIKYLEQEFDLNFEKIKADTNFDFVLNPITDFLFEKKVSDWEKKVRMYIDRQDLSCCILYELIGITKFTYNKRFQDTFTLLFDDALDLKVLLEFYKMINK